jgi:hypothetical protein
MEFEMKTLIAVFAVVALSASATLAAKSDSARVAAATAILDGAFGRSSQTLRSESGPKVSYFILVRTSLPRRSGSENIASKLSTDN